MIGRVAFMVASDFWIIFITRLVYLEAVRPGKYYDMVRFIIRNIVFTYIPSILLAALLVTLIFVSPTNNECSARIDEKSTIDYIIYFTTFALPNAVSSVAILYFLGKWARSSKKKFSLFLLFPIVGLIFGWYYVGIKIWVFFHEQHAPNNNFEIITDLLLVVEPVIYGVLFIAIHCKMKENKDSLLSSNVSISSFGGSEGDITFSDEVS